MGCDLGFKRTCGARHARLARLGFLWLCLPLVAFLAGSGLGADKGTSLQQRLESAKVLRVFNTEGAKIQQFKVTKDLVAFLLWKKDSSVVVAYGLDGTRRFRFGLPDAGDRSLCWFGVSEDGSTLVIAEGLGSEFFNMRVFDISGVLRFSVGSEIEIIPSPAGKYFCSLDWNNSAENLTIYDSVGHETQPLGLMPGWNCRFVTDECLVVADPDTLRFVDVTRGLVTKCIPLEWRGVWEGCPGICVSRSRSLVAVYYSGGTAGTIQLFSASGDLKWTATWRDRLCSVAFDDREEWMALQFGNPGSRSGFVQIVSTSNPTTIYCKSEDISALGSTIFSGYMDGSRFSGGLVAIADPPHAGPNADPNAPVVTVLLEFDDAARAIGPSVTLTGLWCPVPDSRDTHQLVAVRLNEPARLISIAPGGRSKP